MLEYELHVVGVSPKLENLIIEPTTGVAPLDVTITADVRDPDSPFVDYDIYWGDGSPAIEGQLQPGDTLKASHTYTSSQSAPYQIDIVVWDESQGRWYGEEIYVTP